MKNIIITLIAALLCNLVYGQNKLTLDQAAFKVSGATHIVLKNTDFVNEGSFEVPAGTVTFTGDNSNTLQSGGATFYHLKINKSSGQKVSLKDNTQIANQLEFAADGNLLEVDSSDLIMGSAATISGSSSMRFVVTDSTGRLVKKNMSTFTFPVGYDASTYNPLILTESGTPDTIGVRCLEHVLDGGSRGNPLPSAVANTSWELTEAVSGGSTFSATAQWASGDEMANFSNTDCGIMRYHSGDWDLPVTAMSAASGSGPYTQSGTVNGLGVIAVGGDSLINRVQLEVRVFLQGAYSTASSNMRDDLRSADYIPVTEPYNAMAGFTHVGRGGDETVSSLAIFDQAGTDDDVVDWVMVELLDKNNPNTVLETKSALLQRDGDIVDMDGFSPLGIPVINNGYYLKIRHRNHLGIRTPDTLSLSEASSTVYDFTTASSQAFGTNPMAEPATGIFALWGGNARADDNYIRVTPRVFPPPSLNSDRTYILDVILAGDPNATVTGYSNGDINMDGNVRVTPKVFPPPSIESDATFILDQVLGGDPNATRTEQ